MTERHGQGSSVIICPKCGRKNTDMEFIDAFCIECYPVNIETPFKLELEQCKRCSRLKIRNEWTAFNERKVKDFVLARCKGAFDYATYDVESGLATFMVKGKEVKRHIELEMKTVMCTQCSRMSGGYYQGIIQLRGEEGRIKKYADMLVEKLQKKTFITKTEDVPEGIDIYVGNSKVVVELLTDMKETVKMTKKLVGVEEGKRLYRVTFLLRL